MLMSKITNGLWLLIGRLPGRMKFAGDGGNPKAFGWCGVEKSSISSFHRIPVEGEATKAPRLEHVGYCVRKQKVLGS